MSDDESLRPRERRRERLAFDVLDLIQCEPGLSQRKIADRLGISLGQVNFCLRMLHQRALVERPHHPQHGPTDTYVLTRKGVAERDLLGARVLPMKLAELNRLQLQIQRLAGDGPRT